MNATVCVCTYTELFLFALAFTIVIVIIKCNPLLIFQMLALLLENIDFIKKWHRAFKMRERERESFQSTNFKAIRRESEFYKARKIMHFRRINFFTRHNRHTWVRVYTIDTNWKWKNERTEWNACVLRTHAPKFQVWIHRICVSVLALDKIKTNIIFITWTFQSFKTTTINRNGKISVSKWEIRTLD